MSFCQYESCHKVSNTQLCQLAPFKIHLGKGYETLIKKGQNFNGLKHTFHGSARKSNFYIPTQKSANTEVVYNVKINNFYI